MFLVSFIDRSLQFFFPLPLRFLALAILGLVLLANLNLRWMWRRWGVDLLAILQINHSHTDEATSTDPKTPLDLSDAIMRLVWGLGLVYGLAWCLVRLFGPSSPFSILATWSLLLLFISLGRDSGSKADSIDPVILRRSLFRAFGRITVSAVWPRPVLATPLSDVVLADVLTSYAKVLADWDVLFWCHLLVPIGSSLGDGAIAANFPTGKCLPSLFSVALVWYSVMIDAND